MAYKVWYRNDGLLDVDVIADRTAALRRGASMVSDSVGTTLVFVGIEDDQGGVIPRAEFDRVVKGYQLRGLADVPAVCPKYYVEVQLPEALQDEGNWVRYAIETTRVRASKKSIEAAEAFGGERVRITSARTRASTVGARP